MTTTVLSNTHQPNQFNTHWNLKSNMNTNDYMITSEFEGNNTENMQTNTGINIKNIDILLKELNEYKKKNCELKEALNNANDIISAYKDETDRQKSVIKQLKFMTNNDNNNTDSNKKRKKKSFSIHKSRKTLEFNDINVEILKQLKAIRERSISMEVPHNTDDDTTVHDAPYYGVFSVLYLTTSILYQPYIDIYLYICTGYEQKSDEINDIKYTINIFKLKWNKLNKKLKKIGDISDIFKREINIIFNDFVNLINIMDKNRLINKIHELNMDRIKLVNIINKKVDLKNELSNKLDNSNYMNYAYKMKLNNYKYKIICLSKNIKSLKKRNNFYKNITNELVSNKSIMNNYNTTFDIYQSYKINSFV